MRKKSRKTPNKRKARHYKKYRYRIIDQKRELYAVDPDTRIVAKSYKKSPPKQIEPTEEYLCFLKTSVTAKALAKSLKVPPSHIRRLENSGMIQGPFLTDFGGFRIYSPKQVLKIRQIHKLKNIQPPEKVLKIYRFVTETGHVFEEPTYTLPELAYACARSYNSMLLLEKCGILPPTLFRVGTKRLYPKKVADETIKQLRDLANQHVRNPVVKNRIYLEILSVWLRENYHNSTLVG